MNTEQKGIIEKGLLTLDIKENESQIEQLFNYYELLVEWNKVMNLTALTEFEDVVSKHFIDSASICRREEFCKLSDNSKVIDIGTGAGFPGIVLKILYPEIEFVLVDSLNKRIKFLEEVISKLGLNKITAIHARAEDIAFKTQYRESFDICVSRAVANLSTLSEYCVPFVKNNGYFISYKSGNINEELKNAVNAIRILGGDKALIDTFKLPETDIDRSFVIIKKVRNTPKRYPRGQSKPSKEPIK